MAEIAGTTLPEALEGYDVRLNAMTVAKAMSISLTLTLSQRERGLLVGLWHYD